MDMLEYLKRSSAEKLLHLEIDDTHYLSDAAYVSEPSDTPPNQPYAPVIEMDGLPRFRRSIQELWGGRSLASWGEVTLASGWVNGVDLSATEIRGKVIKGFLAGPRCHVPLADRLQIIKGIVGSKKINADGGLSFDIVDDQSRFEAIELPGKQYHSVEMLPSFPAANHGRSKPLCIGSCRNIQPVLIDAATWTYQVSDSAFGPIQSVANVYDYGVPVTVSAVDIIHCTFTLANNPSSGGIITADVDGIKDGATWLTTTKQIVDWLARTFGGLSPEEIDITGLPDGLTGIYLDSPTSLDVVITQLLRGCLGWWGFTRTGVLRARQITAPAAGGKNFGEEKHLSDVVFTEEKDLYWSVPVLYERNWYPLEPALSVSVNEAARLRSEGYEDRIEDGQIPVTYDYAAASPRIETLFQYQPDAEAIGSQALAMFGVVRYRASFSLPVTSLLQLGESIHLSDCGERNGDYLLVGLTDKSEDGIPMVDCEAWG